MKCYICKNAVTKTQLKYGDAHRLTDGTYVHNDCGMNEAANYLQKTDWGGRRNGSGRKPGPEAVETHSVTLYASHVKFLKSLDPKLSLAIRKLIQSRA